ncbi:hypothetical protein TD95_002385 [Thielaviopsis punctulata]|uniref:Enhancer of mRNA-decapping protein 3 n=1 Tax=Thielaviopsis punctulata TaxID=72032 RepID=A0A0F4ZFM2_9PEZI|nr:hypothetical protein TD95_002385 [Thielaviopsis punctulata]
MDQNVVGLEVLVTFHNPPGLQVRGKITNAVPGSSIQLSDVTILGPNPSVVPTLDIFIRDVSNVEVVSLPKSVPTTPAVASIPSSVSPSKKPVKSQPSIKPQPVVPQPQPFVDPAIISVGRPKANRSGSDLDKKTKPAVLPSDVSKIGTPATSLGSIKHDPATEMGAIESGMVNLGLEQSKSGKIPRSQTRETRMARHRRKKEQQKEQRKEQQKEQQKQQHQQQHQQQQIQMQNNPGSGRGKGWRNTPLLEDTKSFQPFAALKRNSKLATGEGWASEDFTDKNEFDFEGGLAKFDKRTVFEEINKCDTIREDERLVYHNLKAKPGTADGKNLHYSENVLGITPAKTTDDFWNSEADVHIEDRRTNKISRKADGRPNINKQQSTRKPSVVPSALQSSGSRVSSQLKDHIVGFYLMPSNRYIDPVSPLQMVTLENTAINELGMPEIVLTENAARGIAEVTLRTLEDPAVRHGLGVSNPQHPISDMIQKCVLLVLAGNNKSGARAIAAARQLRCKGMEVILCVVDLDRDSLLIDAVRHQVRLFRNFGGRVYDKQELFSLYRSAKESGNPITSTLIIDGLLGLTVPFEELRTGEQTTVYELIHWVSKDPGFVISLDIPSGLDPSTGKISIVDGLPLYVKPRYVVSIAAPKKGLAEAISPTLEEDLSMSATAEALRSTVSDGNEWNLFIVDIGLDTAVWKKAGLKVRHAVDFSGEWTCKLTFRGPTAESGDD